MPITTLSSRAFNQDTGAAKKAASNVTDFQPIRIAILNPWPP